MTSSINLNKTFALAGSAASFLLAGVFFSSSHITIPTILETSTTLEQITRMLSQWRFMYNIGLPTALTLGGISVTSTILAVYGLRQQGASWGVLGNASTASSTRTLLIAAAVTGSFMPWTLLAILPTNNALFALDDAVRSGGQVSAGKVVDLIENWRMVNYLRALLPLVGGLLGLSVV